MSEPTKKSSRPINLIPFAAIVAAAGVGKLYWPGVTGPAYDAFMPAVVLFMACAIWAYGKRMGRMEERIHELEQAGNRSVIAASDKESGDSNGS